jgi:hypothetical protein
VFAVLYLSFGRSWPHRFYKLAQTREWLPDFEQPVEHYELAHIDPEKQAAVLRWLKETRWPEFGIWHAERPGVAWTAKPELLAPAFEELAGRHPLVEHPWICRAPVRFAPQKQNARFAGDYPHIRGTRPRAEIRYLRGKHPNTPHDLAWTPSDILEGLRDRWGRPLKPSVPANPLAASLGF